MIFNHIFGWATSAENLPIRNDDGPTLESLDHASISAIGRTFLTELSIFSLCDSSAPDGLINISGSGLSQLMNAIPGLRTLDADAMNSADVARLVHYVRSRNPSLFADIVLKLAQERPAAALAIEQLEVS